MAVSVAPRIAPNEADLHGRLVACLHDAALVIGKVTLSSGREAEYYVDAKRATLEKHGASIVGQLVALHAKKLGATVVGGLTIGADPIVSAALAASDELRAGFLVRKERKQHGLQRWIEGPELGPDDRCLIVDDVVTTGSSTILAIERVREEGLRIVGVVSVLDRLAGGGDAIKQAVECPYTPLATIDQIHPDRPDR